MIGRTKIEKKWAYIIIKMQENEIKEKSKKTGL